MMSKRERLLMWGVILLVGMFAADRLVVSPLQSRLDRLSNDLQAEEARINEANVLIDNKQLIQSRWASRMASGLHQDPADARMAIQSRLSEAAEQTGLALNNLSAGGNLDSGSFTEVRFSLTASGELPSVARFLEKVQEMPVPLAVLTCDLSKRSDSNQLTLRLTVSTLVLNDVEAG